MRKLVALGMLCAAAALAGCKSETTSPPSTTLSPGQRQALSATLGSSPQMGSFGPLASAALAYVTQYGQIQITTGTTTATYNAVGLWMNINAMHGTTPVVSEFFTVLAWQGSGATIQALSLVLGAGNSPPVTDTLSASFNGTRGGTGMFGTAPFGTTDVYLASAGTLVISGVSFGGGTAFTAGTLNGTYAPGSLTGHYTFLGMNSLGTTSQQSSDFSVGIPAVQFMVQGTF